MILHIPDYEFEAMYESARHQTSYGEHTAESVSKFMETDQRVLACFGLIVWKTWHHQVELEKLGGRE